MQPASEAAQDSPLQGKWIQAHEEEISAVGKGRGGGGHWCERMEVLQAYKSIPIFICQMLNSTNFSTSDT